MSETTRSFSVEGMTCQHCVRSVHEEVSEVDGVSSVEVDLDSGRLIVVGDAPDAAIRDAVTEAGYDLVA
jgi:copper chaperone